ncbi:MAG: CBS domain-containing protein, partial [Gaiellales bacterium]
MRPQQVIVTHAGMDFDALGALVAARRLYPQARVCVHGGMNRNVREFASLHADELDLADPSSLDLSGVTRVVVVETPHRSRLGPFAELLGREGVEVTLFDHHLGPDEPSPDWVSPGCHVRSADGALSTTMVSILAERGLEPTPTEATALALGIHEDTGSLTYPTTTLRDIEALAFCARHGASQELVGGFLHTPLGGDERVLLTTLLDTARTHMVGGTPVLVAAAAWPRYVDGVSTLATKIVELSDCRALVMLVEMEGRVFAVGRSRVPALDMRIALAPVGGGGHAPASSSIVRGATLAEVRERIVAALPDAIAAAPRARDIMSTPAWFVSAAATIDQALDECRRRHTSGVQVEAGGVLAGAAAREDLDKAIGHGLGHAPVRAVMSSLVAAVSPDAPLAEVQRARARSAAGRLAVVAEAAGAPPAVESVLGVVTRSDLLAALRDARAPVEEHAAPGDLGEQLATLGLDRLWRAVQHAAGGFEGVYLVGGAVRDLLLGER